MTYKEKLLDPRWQKKRLQILDRDNFTCQCCGDNTRTLNVHHKSYLNNPWDIDNTELITYCSDCHVLIELIKITHDYHKIKKITKSKLFKNNAFLYTIYLDKDTIDLYIVNDGQAQYQLTLNENYINTIKNLIDGNL
jgi:hypothetical protein